VGLLQVVNILNGKVIEMAFVIIIFLTCNSLERRC
jgi:hypothetical protein